MGKAKRKSSQLWLIDLGDLELYLEIAKKATGEHL